jgi:hypothetical protein
LIGKPIRQEEVYDELMCGCGNGFCGEGENEFNCPSDCARILTAEKILVSGPLIIYAFLMLTFLLSIGYTVKKYVFLKQTGIRWLEAIAIFLFIDIAATVLYSTSYQTHISLAYASEAFLAAYLIVLEIWTRKTGYHKILHLRKAAKDIADNEHHLRKFNLGATHFVSAAFRPITKVEEKVKQLFHKEFEGHVSDVNKALERIRGKEYEMSIREKVKYRPIEDLSKSKINQKFSDDLEVDVKELRKKLEKFKKMGL